MLKSEFEKAIYEQITGDEYEIIETVYMYYYTVNDLDKSFYVHLFNCLGMSVFYDMYPRAKAIQNRLEQIKKAEREIKLLEQGKELSNYET